MDLVSAMSPPTQSIKDELNHAVARGIRRRGPDAVGLVLMGMASLVIMTLALGVLLIAVAVSGTGAITLGLAGVTLVTGLLKWLAGRYSP